MYGRAIGFVFGVPLAFFALRGQIPRSLAPTLGGLFVLGGSQGLVGWWMVKSGLEAKRVDEIDGGIPRVSPYRLATHLTCAFTIFTLLLHTGLGVLQPRAAEAAASLAPVQRRARLLALLVGVTAISGAFVAGMQAGLAFNTFPLMEGRVVPEGYMELRPLYRNFFESVPSVQLHHRLLALTTVSSVTAFWLYARALPLPPQLRLCTNLLLLAAYGQAPHARASLARPPARAAPAQLPRSRVPQPRPETRRETFDVAPAPRSLPGEPRRGDAAACGARLAWLGASGRGAHALLHRDRHPAHIARAAR